MDKPDVPQFEFACTAEGAHIRMGACLTNIDRADAEISAILKQQQVAVDHFAVRILLREAALNAVIHGSGQDPAREVRIALQVDRAGILLTVEDDGPGFTWQNRTLAFDLTGDGGRGLALMQMYSSRVTFNERGNQVALRCDSRTAALAVAQQEGTDATD